MRRRRKQTPVPATPARSGSAGHVIRWALDIGVLLAIAAMSLAWTIPALRD